MLKNKKSKNSLIRPPNLKDRNNGISIPKMLPKTVGHDFIHLSKSPWKISVVKQNNKPIITKNVIFVLFQWTLLVQSKKTLT